MGRGKSIRLLTALALAGLTGGCFQPLYDSRPSVQSDSVHDKLSSIDITMPNAPRGTYTQRIASQIHNALIFDCNGGTNPVSPAYRLNVSVGSSTLSVIVDVTSGRPDAQLEAVSASYQLVEIATGKVVVSDSTYAHVDFDIPGAAQRFAELRAQRDAEDRASQVVAEAIRNRLASYFVAGT